MRRLNRKTAPKVRDGIVQYKNNWNESPNIYNTDYKHPVFDKERPGRGYKHLIKKNDLYSFIDILPDWEELSIGLNAVLLAAGDAGAMGWYNNGIVAICAWNREIYWDDCELDFYTEHSSLLNKLEVPCKRQGKYWNLEFTENTAKAFQLVHIFIHELGHHHDRMTTKSKRATARGECYAETYAQKYEDQILEKYREQMGDL